MYPQPTTTTPIPIAIVRAESAYPSIAVNPVDGFAVIAPKEATDVATNALLVSNTLFIVFVFLLLLLACFHKAKGERYRC